MAPAYGIDEGSAGLGFRLGVQGGGVKGLGLKGYRTGGRRTSEFW